MLTVHQVAMTWAQRLKRIFNIDIETGRECGGHVKVIACIEDPVVIKKILMHLKEKSNKEKSNLAECLSLPRAGHGSKPCLNMILMNLRTLKIAISELRRVNIGSV